MATTNGQPAIFAALASFTEADRRAKADKLDLYRDLIRRGIRGEDVPGPALQEAAAALGKTPADVRADIDRAARRTRTRSRVDAAIAAKIRKREVVDPALRAVDEEYEAAKQRWKDARAPLVAEQAACSNAIVDGEHALKELRADADPDVLKQLRAAEEREDEVRARFDEAEREVKIWEKRLLIPDVNASEPILNGGTGNYLVIGKHPQKAMAEEHVGPARTRRDALRVELTAVSMEVAELRDAATEVF